MRTLPQSANLSCSPPDKRIKRYVNNVEPSEADNIHHGSYPCDPELSQENYDAYADIFGSNFRIDHTLSDTTEVCTHAFVLFSICFKIILFLTI